MSLTNTIDLYLDIFYLFSVSYFDILAGGYNNLRVFIFYLKSGRIIDIYIFLRQAIAAKKNGNLGEDITLLVIMRIVRLL